MKYETEMIEQLIKENSEVLHRLSIIEKQEFKIDDLVSLTLWAARRLPKIHSDIVYKELISIVGKEHKHLYCVEDEIKHLLTEEED